MTLLTEIFVTPPKERNGQDLVALANPLSATHDFLQTCSECYFLKGISNSLVRPPSVSAAVSAYFVVYCWSTKDKWRKFKCRQSFHHSLPLPFLTFFSDRRTDSFSHKPDLVHSCKQDILLCRRKTQPPSEWTRVRPIPRWMGFTGPYKLCKGTNLPVAWLINIESCSFFDLIVCFYLNLKFYFSHNAVKFLDNSSVWDIFGLRIIL